MVAAEGDVRQRGAAGVVAHPAAVDSLIAAEGEVGERGAAGVVVHPAAVPVGLAAVGVPGSDGKAIQSGRLRHSAAGDDVVGVVALDVSPRFGDVVAIRIRIVPVNVAAEDGHVRRPVALVALRLTDDAVAAKAAIDGYPLG